MQPYPRLAALARGRAGAALVFLLVMLPATWLLYGGTVNGWWCCDDSQLLKFAIKYSPWQYFAVPQVWREAVISSLTPWEVLDYDIDYALFGANAAAFYARNLLAIAFTGWTVYLVARQWVDRAWPAVAAGLLFLVGSPVAISSEQLMGRHYTEGLAAFLLALYLYVRAAREQWPGLMVWAALAYAVAASAKEIFMPLGLVPFMLPLGPLRLRARLGWPFVGVMLLYLPWRTYMLGNTFGGYQPAGSWASVETLQAIATQLLGVPGWMLTDWGIGIAAAALLLALWLAPRRQLPWVLVLSAVVLGLLLMPLLALARHPGLNAHRYFLTLWTALALVVPVGLAPLAGHPRRWAQAVAPVMLVGLGASALATTLTTVKQWRVAAVEQAVQGKVIASAGSDTVVYLTPMSAGWSAAGLVALRPAMGKTDTPPLLVADQIELAALPLAGKKVLRYNNATARMDDVTAAMPQVLAQWRAQLAAMPVSLLFEYEGKSQTVRWQSQAGTQPGARLTYLGDYLGQIGRVEVPMQSAMRIPPSYIDACFRFRFDTADGRVAYTPPLALPAAPDADGVRRLRWEGVFAPGDVGGEGCGIRAGRP